MRRPWYRTALEQHLRETHDHAARLQSRIGEDGPSRNPLQATVGFAGSVIARALSVGKAPYKLVRGAGGETKVLQNTKDLRATAAREIANYTAIERLAGTAGDASTARLAASIRVDKEKLLERIGQKNPKPTKAKVRGNNSDAAGKATKPAAKPASVKRAARKPPPAARPAGAVTAKQDRAGVLEAAERERSNA